MDPVIIEPAEPLVIEMSFGGASHALLQLYTTTEDLQANYATKAMVQKQPSSATGDFTLAFDPEVLTMRTDMLDLTTGMKEQVVELETQDITLKLDSSLACQKAYITNSTGAEIDLGELITTEDPTIVMLGKKSIVENGATAVAIFTTAMPAETFDPDAKKKFVQFLNTI